MKGSKLLLLVGTLPIFLFFSCSEESVSPPANTVTFWAGANMTGYNVTISLDDYLANRCYSLDVLDLMNDISSISWDLADGRQVILYAGSNCSLKPLPLEGKNQYMSLAPVDLDNDLESFEIR